MTFPSIHAPKIWDNLYTVLIPDQITLNPEYIRRFGVYITQNKQIDKMLENNLIMVKIPIIQILDYYDRGIEVQIPNREDMITIHKHIELYLAEWKEYIQTSVHGQIDAQNNKELLTALEKLSKYIYEKAKPYELLDNLYLRKNNSLGIINPLQRHIEENKPIAKLNYQGIRQLIKRKPSNGDSNGRF